MRKIATFLLILHSLLISAQQVISKVEVLHAMNIVNGCFMQKHTDPTIPTNVKKIRPSNLWTRAVYYEGLMAFYKVQPQKEFYDYATKWAEFHKWDVRDGVTTRDADNQCCAQTYIELYKIDPKPEKIANIQANIDRVVKSPENNDWTWIDAIQMAMPVYASLGNLTKNKAYFNKMYAMYSHSRNIEGGKGLYNPKHGLWWRDARYLPPFKEPNGKDCYWSRGNGWVYAALVRVLNELPENEKHRKLYISDFRAMSKALKALQREDGFWNVSLHDPTNFGGKETTGTSLFLYGMAWGINNGILNAKEYLPVVTKAWYGLQKYAVQPTGELGWVQGTAQEPKDGQPLAVDKIPNFDDFGTGCFLLGASEVYKLSICK